MPIKPSAFKALRQSHRRAQRNLKIKTDLTALTRRLRQAIGKQDKSQARQWLSQIIKRADKAVKKGIVKKNTAARIKSRLAKKVNTLLNK